ncbi:MAG: hypothetical protein U0075_13695 [Thermomicrobiales bacterium]
MLRATPYDGLQVRGVRGVRTMPTIGNTAPCAGPQREGAGSAWCWSIAIGPWQLQQG